MSTELDTRMFDGIRRRRDEYATIRRTLRAARDAGRSASRCELAGDDLGARRWRDRRKQLLAQAQREADQLVPRVVA